MSPAIQVVLSGVLTFGIPLVLALREVSIIRKNGPPPQGGTEPRRPVPPRPRGGEPDLKPLPACLLPPYPPLPDEERRRVLEDVEV
jgi:hypothetical protein